MTDISVHKDIGEEAKRYDIEDERGAVQFLRILQQRVTFAGLFVELGHRYGCGSEQDNEAVLRGQVQELRSQLMKMTGSDDDLSFSELQALKNHLLDAKRIVEDQRLKKEREEEEQKKKAEDEDDGTRREVSVPRKSSTSRHEKQDNGASMVQSKLERFERRKSEPLQTKYDRLWLFNERMNGREIESLTSHDLLLLQTQILEAVTGLRDQMTRPRLEHNLRARINSKE